MISTSVDKNIVKPSNMLPGIYECEESGLIVLFTDKESGVVLRPGTCQGDEDYNIGDSSDEWVAYNVSEIWTRLNGEVTLKQID